MKTPVLHFVFLALLSSFLTPLAVAYASPSPADSVHFCQIIDPEEWERERALLPAAKRLQDLNVGEPRTVRLIYFLPNDRPFRADLVQRMKDEIREVQSFYAEQMQAHGYGNKTFQFETDDQGEPMVHRVDGQHPDRHYLDNSVGTVHSEIQQAYDFYANIYFIVLDYSKQGERAKGIRQGKNGGLGLVYNEFIWFTATHELGHSFGLQHDFRDNAYIMSYGSPNRSSAQLSACAAEYLAVHPYFNPDIPIEAEQPPTIDLISSPEYPVGSESVPVRLRVRDAEGLHQVLLFVFDKRILSPDKGNAQVKACRGLAGENDAVVEFNYNGEIPSVDVTSLSNLPLHEIRVVAVDTAGNQSFASFTLREVSLYEIATLSGHTDPVISVAFSPDGTTLASGAADAKVRPGDEKIRLWNVATRENIATLSRTTYPHAPMNVNSVAFSPDGTTLASGASDNKAKLWDVATRELIGVFPGGSKGLYNKAVNSVAFSPDGTMLAAGDGGPSVNAGTVKLWDVVTKENIATLEGHPGPVTSVAFSPDGTTLASGSTRSTIKLWDVATLTNIATIDAGHWEQSTVTSVAFSPDGTILASGGGYPDNNVLLWDVAAGESIAILFGHTSTVSSVVFSPDGTTLASGSYDSTIKLWDAGADNAIASFATLTGHTGGVRSVAFSPDGTMLASASLDNKIKLWDTSEWTTPPVINHPPTGAVTISGTAEVGEPLTADASAVIDPDGPSTLEFSYQWLADASPIAGATSQTYTLTANEIGKKIRVRVSYIDGLGALVNITSEETELFAGICDRTEEVQTVILNLIAGVSDCALVTGAHLAAITELGLEGQSIPTLQVGDFDGLTALTSLDLDNNQLASLPVGIFDNLTALRHLYLTDNQLTTVPEGTFDNLGVLETLYLTNNQLTVVPEGIDNLTTLIRLALNSNQLTTVPEGTFDNLTNLTSLDLAINQLTALPVGIDKLTNLTSLDLDRNQLTSLPVGVFDNLTNLTVLDLGDNQMASLPEGTFDNLTNLTQLYLDNNQLTALPEGIFGNLNALTTLHLDGNLLTSLPEGIFDGVALLTTLTLYNGPVDPLPLMVSLEKVGEDQVKAVAPSGAPFDMVLPLSVASGSISGGATTITIPVGSVESQPLTVTRTPGTLAAVTVDIGTLPGLPPNHQGYALVKSADLPLEVFGLLGTEVTTYNVGDTIPLPTGFQTARLTIGSGRAVTADNGTYTCVGAVECIIANGAVTQGTIEVTTGEVASNNAPEFTDGVSTTLSVAENTVAGVNLGAAIAATDADNEVLTYTLGGTDAAAFAIERATGQLQTSAALDYETKSSYSVVVTVSDGSLTDTITVTINVTDLDESLIPVCDRTPQVRDAIVAAVPNVSTCGDVTGAHLAALQSLYMSSKNITALKADDFSGLSALTRLDLWNNDLSSLPDGVFNGLSALSQLWLFDNDLSSLPDGIFDGLSALTNLDLTGNQLSSLPDGVFNGLTALTNLGLAYNDLSSLPDGVFNGLSTLTNLWLENNDLSSLPDGVFSGLSELTTLSLQDNAVTSLPLTVSLVKVGTDQFKAVAPAGAPFAIVLPISITNGRITGGATTITIPAGSVESESLTATRTPGRTSAVIVDIRTLPGLPANHSGYALVKSDDLPLAVIDPLADDSEHTQDVTLVTNTGQPYTWYDDHGQKGFDLPSALTGISWEPLGGMVGTAGGFIIGGTFAGPGGALAGAATGAATGVIVGSILDKLLQDIEGTYDTHTHPFGVWIDGGLAQEFTTGSNSFGYDLSSIAIYGRYYPDLPIEVPLSISIWSSSNGIPGSLLYTLPFSRWGNDGSYGLKLNYQAPVAAILEPGTRYVVVIGYLDETRVVITSSPSEDAGTLTGWSIGNGLQKKNGDVWRTLTPEDAGRGVFPADKRPVLRTALYGTSLDSRSIIVSLEKVGGGQFKATATTSAPFDIVLPLNVNSGGGASSITISAGRTESDVLSVSRTPGTTLPVSVDIGNLPSPPATHADYALFKSPSRLPLQVIDRVSGGVTPVCARTALVRDAIVRAAPVSTCGEVTEAHLAAINTLSDYGGGDVRYKELQTGDFSGLTALTGLYLSHAYITTLPDGIFDDLTSLKALNLYLSPLTSGLDEVLGLTSLTSLNLGYTGLSPLPAGAFDRLTQLTSLDLSGNKLTSLPDGVFDRLTSLTSLNLEYNDLTSLPAGVFDRLTSLTSLNLDGLELTSLPAGVFDNLTSLTRLSMVNSFLSSLSADDFSGLSSLTSLNLYNCRLTGLPAGIFSGLSSLTSLNLSRSRLTSLPAGIFDQLINLTTLELSDTQLTSLPAGIFDQLTALTELDLSNNQLASLPDGLFSGLPSLTRLRLQGNAVDPLPLTVSLEKIGTDQFKAVAPAGAPFDIVLPLTVTNGTINGGATALMIPIGSAESEPLTVTRTPGTTFTVTVDIGTLPGLPTDVDRWGSPLHRGYTLVKSADLPLAFPELGGAVLTPVCDRTPQVRDAIVAAAPVNACSAVTETHLTAIDSLELYSKSISALKAGDFSGLISLIHLNLNDNQLSSLPDGIFDDLTELTRLAIGSNQLSSLPEGIFDDLTKLTLFEMVDTPLSSLPEGIFDGLTELILLGLNDNQLSSLPEGIFDGLTKLTTLRLQNNQLSSLPEGIFDGLTELISLDLRGNAVAPLPLTVSLQKVGADQVKAVAPTGAPFEIVLPISIANGSIDGGATTITIPAGSVESQSLAVTRTPGTTFAVTVDIGTLPRLRGQGYVLVKSADLPLAVIDPLAGAPTPVCDRTPQVRDVLVAAVPGVSNCRNVTEAHLAGITILDLQRKGITALKAGDFDGLNSLIRLWLRYNELSTLPVDIFDGLTSLTTLYLNSNALTSLPEGIFDGLTELRDLHLSDNALTSLPAGIFDGLAELRLIWLSGNALTSLPAGIFDGLTEPLIELVLSGNAVNPLPLTVSLEKVGTNQFKAVAPSGVPFDIVLPLTLTNGSITGGASTLTIPVGSVESETLTVTRTPGTTFAVTVNIGDPLPVLSGRHQGYALVKSADLPLEMFSGLAGGICDRTPQVQTAILGVLQLQTPSPSTCGEVTETHLATGITSLFLNGQDITTLQAGDFAGLTSLTELRLYDNQLTTLPADLFDGLTALTTLYLQGNQLSTLPEGLFDGLASLATLYLYGNSVDPLPLTVSLEKVGADQVKAVAPAGTPFDLVLPLTVTNGSISGGATSITIPAGSLESQPLTVTRTPSTTAAVTMDIGTLPRPPTNHSGYTLVKSADLPLEIISATTPNTATVNIPDANLRAKIESALGKTSGDPISPAEMATLTALSAQDASISDLTGLETATNLTELQLWDNNIADIAAVAGLTKLTKLYLWGNAIADISHVAALTNLTDLRLGENSIANVSAVAALTQLTHLGLRENSISDIAAVAGLTNLTELRIGDNTISSITAVASLTKLVWLDAPNNSISDMAAVANLTNLNSLNLSGNSIADLSAVAGLTNLLELYLAENAISDLSPLVSNTGLGANTEIDVQGNPLSYPSIYTHIPALQARSIYIEFDNRTPTTLVKASGDSQQGTPETALEQPFVVEVQDANSIAFAGVPVTFAITAGGGTLSATNTTTDANGQAQSTLTLGTSTGTNTVQVRVQGIAQTETFTVEATTDTAVDEGTEVTTYNVGDTIPLPTGFQTPSLTIGSGRAISAANGTYTCVGAVNCIIEDDVVTQGTIEVTTSAVASNNAPEFTDGASTTLSVAENTAAGVNLGAAIAATDADNDVLTYTLGGTDAAAFAIDSTTGQVQTSAALDYETKSSYSVVVTVSDGSLTDTITVTIDVTDLDESLIPVCDRAPQVRDAIVAVVPGISTCGEVTKAHLTSDITSLFLNGQGITTLQVGDFEDLTSLTELRLYDNQLTTLPADLFDGLGALTMLYLNGNQLSSLPDGLFDGLSSLATLYLYGNSVDPLPLIVSLEKVGADQVKAVAPSGAPFDIVLPLTVANGSISGGASSITIPAGSLESQPLTVTRTPDTSAAVTMDIGTLPGLPANHSGYTLAKSTDLPLEVIGEVAVPVTIPDANLRAKIESALGKTSGDPISAAEMATLTSLSAQDAAISDLTGLETATNLTDLQLWDNNITDIAAVAGLTNLTKLYLWGNTITDIAAIAALTNLTDLRLGENSIANVSAVAALTNLTHLGLRENSVSDIAAVAGLTNLTELRIGDNTISSIAAVANLTNLIWLDAPNNSISDIAAVANLTSLTSLTMSGNSITDLSAVAGLTNLLELYLAENAISDLSPLVSNTGLGENTEIDVQGNPLDYPSIYTHIPALQARSVFIDFDNRTPTTLAKVSGDSQQGTPSTALAQPFVVEVQDANSVAFAGVPVVFAVTAGGGTLSTTSTTTDANGQAASTLTLGSSAGTNTVQVRVQGIAQSETFTAEATTTNTAPVFTDGESTTRTVAENTAAGVNIGTAIAATDADNDVLTYTLGGTDAAAFDMESTTGQLQTKAALDYETKTSYSVVVTVSDGGLTDAINVTINVTDLDEQPQQPEGLVLTARFEKLPTSHDGSSFSFELHFSEEIVISFANVRDDVLDVTGGEVTGAQRLEAGSNVGWEITIESASDAAVSIVLPPTTDCEAAGAVCTDDGRTLSNRLTATVSGPAILTGGICDRTPQVQTAILGVLQQQTPSPSTCGEVTQTHLATGVTSLFLNDKSITALQAGDFAGLTSLTELRLYDNQLSTLPADLFDDLSALTTLYLNGNQLSTLPDGLFDGLSALTTLYLNGNAVDPLPLTVSLEKVGADQVKAVAPSGAPFEMVLPLSVANGSISGGTTTLTIPAGSLESQPLTVVRTPGTSAAVTVDIGTLPGLPANHSGYTLAKSSDLPLEIFSLLAGGICDRTPQVQTAILAAVPSVSTCDNVTAAHLAAITSLNVDDKSIESLKAGDFDGLSALTTLVLSRNQLTSLPEKLFAGLSSLKDLYLNNNRLESLPEKLFAGLPSLTQINLHTNRLESLPEKLFSGLPSLTQLFLRNNRLTSLSADLFSNLSSLRYLYLDGNQLTSLPAEAFSGPSSLTQLLLNNNQLTSLPVGVFRGLSTLAFLWLHENAVDPLPLTVSLVKVEEGQFKATAPAGAPFDIVLPLRIVDGTITDEANSITIPAGRVESDVVTVTRTPGTTAAVTVDIGTLPGLPADHQGYQFAKSTDLPLAVISSPANTAPAFTDGESTTRTVAENSANGVLIGTAIAATDADNDVLTYTLGGTDAAAFDIERATGQLKTSAALDYETKSSYSVVVTVSDGSLTDAITVTINITDLDDSSPVSAETTVCDRTPQVQIAILGVLQQQTPSPSTCGEVTQTHLATGVTSLFLNDQDITALQAGDFAGLTSLMELRMYDNQLSTLPADLFDGLTALTMLYLNGNQLTTLPDGLFDGLTALTTLYLYGNSVDPLPLTVSLEKIGADQVKAVAPSGAPFELVLPLSVTNGSISGGAITIAIPAGSLESQPLTVSRTPGTSAAVTVDFGTLPGLPANHSGYALVKSADLPLEMFSLLTGGICDRTPQVQTAILAAVPGTSTCDEVTAAHLASITSLNVADKSIGSLKVGDFDGLSALTTLSLTNNQLSSLPAGIFDNLSALTGLYLGVNQLSSLPVGIFDKLNALTALNLSANQLSSLPDGIFDNLNALTRLYLAGNQLSSLPDGIFDNLNTLTGIDLGANSVNPLLLTVSLEKVGEGQFKATAPAGAPFDIVLPLTVVDGTITGGANSVTIRTGRVESDVVTVTRTPGTTAAVAVAIGVLPGLPANHLGYALVKSADLPLEVISAPANTGPVFTDGTSTSRTVAENSANGVLIGTAIAATDADNDVLTYTLGGTDAASFDIERATGQLKTSAALDYETKSSYSVVVTVSDGSLTDTINVTINVTDLAEQPAAVDRTAFESSTPSGYTEVTLSKTGSVWGTPTKFTNDSKVGILAFMVLGKLKGCSFANAEAARPSKVYIKTQDLGSQSNYESETVCGTTTRSYDSWDGSRITHLRFFDESSTPNIKEAVYNAATGQIEISGESIVQQPEQPEEPEQPEALGLTARFAALPTSHDGSEFTFELHFSEEIEISFATVRDDVFDVTGGTVTGARRLQTGSSLSWEISIKPNANAQVLIVLSPTDDCEADDAVCTADGQPLSNSLAALVPGAEQPEEPGNEGGGLTLSTSIASPLTEATLDESVVTLTLSGGTYERSSRDIRGAVAVAGIPGVTVGSFDVDRVSDTAVTVELTFDGTDFDTDATLTFTVGSGAIVDYDGAALTAQIAVAAGMESVVASTASPLTEATLDESVVTLTLSGGAYESSRSRIRRAVTVSGISGVTVRSLDVDRVSDTVVTVELTFDGTDFDTAGTLTFTVAAEAIANYNGSPLTAQIVVTTATEVEDPGTSDEEPDPPEQSEELGLMARFAALPTSHDGSEFTFELHFSEEIEISFATVRDDVFDVTGGTVTGARRLQTGSSLSWEISIKPNANAQVLIVLSPTDDCEADDAVCTADGQPLSNSLAALVPGAEQPEEPGNEGGGLTLSTSIASPLTEATLDESVVTLTLSGGTYERSSRDIRGAVAVAGIPGVTVGSFDVDRVSDTAVTVELTFDGTDFDTDATLTFTVGSGAIVDYDGAALTAQIAVAAGMESVVASTASPLTEATLDESVVTLTLSGGAYESSRSRIRRAVTVSGISGVTVRSLDVDRVSDTVVTVELTFDGTDFDTAGTLTFTVAAEAIANYNGSPLTAQIVVTTATEVEDPGTSDEEPDPPEQSEELGLMARFAALPTSHDGSEFTFELHFSEEIEISFATVRDDVFDVTGGTVTGARRLQTGSSLGWEITIEPNANAQVLIVLSPTADCDAAGAVCTADGQPLSNSLVAIVPGAEQPDELGGPTITASTASPLTEATLHESVVTLTLSSGAYESSRSTIRGAVTVAGIAGVTVRRLDVDRVSDTVVTVELTFDGTNFDTDATLTLIVGADAIADYDGSPLTAQIAVAANIESEVTEDDGDQQPDSPEQPEEAVLLTARFEAMPAVHDSSSFTFELHFSEEIEISYRNIEDDVLDVTGGVVKGARRLQAGSNLGWNITIEPDSTSAEVSIVLPPTTDCEAAGAVCTEDGRPLSNELTAIVPGLLTARFEDMPAAHDGSEFTFELHFSEEIEISFVNVRDDLFDVTGGVVKGARRLQAGSNLGWNITIEPDSDAQVLIVLPPTDDCDAAGAVCTEDGRPLSNELTASVPGPAAKPVVAPLTSGLDANYPNPFNAQTQLVYTLPMAGPVELAIYNVMGQRVRTLVQDVQAAGRHQIAWDGRSDHGTTLASGVYLSRLVSTQGVQVRRLLLLK